MDNPPSPDGPSPRRRPSADPRWSQALTALALVIGLVGVASGSTVVTGIGVILLGAVCLAWALTQSPEQVRDRLRGTRTSGALIARPMSWMPGNGAKILFSLLSLAIVALGVAAVVSAL